MIRWLARLEGLDRRWLYGGTVVLLVVPLVVLIPMPSGSATQATHGLYDRIDSCPPEKVVLIDSSWDMGSRAENQAQLECVVRHLCRRRVRFLVTSLGVTPFAPEFAARVIEPIAAEAGYVYGRDWVNTGYVPAGGNLGAVIDGLCRDVHAVRPEDTRGTPVAELPLMQHVRSIQDVHLVYCITYSPVPEWISFVKGQHATPVAFGCMSIMSPNYYTYLDSGQLCGMLAGNLGAAEYEALLEAPARGTRLLMAAAFGNCAILLAALLGNLGQWAARRKRRQAP
jgi:hypothetical protein